MKRSQASGRHQVRTEYRQHKASLRALLGDAHNLLSEPGGEAMIQVLGGQAYGAGVSRKTACRISRP